MKIVNVNPNGNAPSGLSVGDIVKTGGGNYQVAAPGSAGASYNPQSGYWSVRTDSSVPESIQSYLNYANDVANANNSAAQLSADRQMQFQRESNAKAMKFSADQAQLNRDWQERMSNTAHQREVNDLISAGLNPVLSANSGAAVPSGATASGIASSGASPQMDMSANSVLGGLLTGLISRNTVLNQTALNNETSRIIAEIQAQTSMMTANIASGATKYAATMAAEASKYVADTSASISDKDRDQPGGLWGTINKYVNKVFNSMSDVKDDLGVLRNNYDSIIYGASNTAKDINSSINSANTFYNSFNNMLKNKLEKSVDRFHKYDEPYLK